MTQMTNGLRPTHPGEILREDVLPALGLPKTEIARAHGAASSGTGAETISAAR